MPTRCMVPVPPAVEVESPTSADYSMRGSAKGEEPIELREWKVIQRAGGVALEYKNLRRIEKDAMHQSLFLEQTGQCVYCGRRIELNGTKNYHIEHFRPRAQDKYPHLELDYSNLFLSCGSHRDSGAQGTCGNHKGEWFDEECHIPPVPESCAERFRYHLSGKVADDGSREAQRMLDVLNLNHSELIRERKEIIEDLETELERGIPHRELSQDYLDIDGSGARPGFSNVAIGYLRENC